jgi:hypothetical protein
VIVIQFRDKEDDVCGDAVRMTFGGSGELILEDREGVAIRGYAAGHWATAELERPHVDVDPILGRHVRGS